jgi:hypothetical protein
MAIFRARLAVLGATLLEPEWLGAQRKHRAICAGGHECYARPSNVAAGQGICAICAGQSPAVAEAAFRERLTELGATLIERTWLGAMKKHHVICRGGHDVYTKPNWIQQGRGLCRRCAGLDPRDAEAAFRARLAELGVELLEPYINSQVGHRARCAAGHDCRPRPTGLQRGEGPCVTCAGKDWRVAETAFLARLKEQGAIPLYEKWLGGGKRHRIRCAAGHECAPRPSDVGQGGNLCKTCSGKDPVASEARFLARLKELGATPLYEEWTTSADPHRVRCALGHECYPRPSGVLLGLGVCRFCAGAEWDAFYVTASSEAVKFGVTSGDPRPRLRVHAARGYTEVIRLATGLPGTIAPDAERAVLAALATAGEKPIEGREYFERSCLALILDVADSWLTSPAKAERDAEVATVWLQDELFAA